MAELSLSTPISRRRALSLGGGIAAAGGALTSLGPLAGVALGHDRPRDHDHHGEHHGDHRPQDGTLPADEIQEIVEAAGTVTKGVLSIDIERQDIGDVAGPLGVTFTPAFQVDGTSTFQPLGRHYIETVPNVWFIHFRGEGDPLSLARSVHDVLTATSTPLPQTMPASPTTPA